MRSYSNRPNEHWGFISNKLQSNTRLAIFIHGYRGNYLTTWGKLPDLIYRLADSDATLKKWDFLFLGYKTSNVETYLDIAKIISTQWNLASQGAAPFKNSYGQVALFGHSLGTLGIRQLLCAWTIQPSNMINEIKSVSLFGSPINGSWLARYPVWQKIAPALAPANPQLRMLKEWNECAHGKHPWPEVKVLLGLDDKVVGHKYSTLIDWTGDDDIIQTNLDHGDLVKPVSWKNSIIIDHIKNVLA